MRLSFRLRTAADRELWYWASSTTYTTRTWDDTARQRSTMRARKGTRNEEHKAVVRARRQEARSLAALQGQAAGYLLHSCLTGFLVS